jgi:polysaccharide pyruvyl transferase WcaK-like protein
MIVGALNVKYSANLGDGLLAECLEAELRACGPDIQTLALDLAGRSDYGDGLPARRAVMSLLEATPQPLRRGAVGALLDLTVQRRLRPRWRRELAGVDAVVLGGGNLLADADLNFPIKIEGALAEAAAAGLPLGVFGIGVSDNWSARGGALFRRALVNSRLVHAAVRDEQSKAVWDRRLGPAGVRPALVCRDPAVLAARHFPASPKRPGPFRVGLGLTSPLAIRYHATGLPPPDGDLARWTADLVAAMCARGWEVSLFTNGSPEDRDYLQSVAPQLQAAGASLAAPFSRPRDLAGFVSGHDLVLAHRMHACIAAYAYGTPHIGFAWDEKLQRFFDSVGRGGFVVEAGRAPTADVVALAARALADGIAGAPHAACLREARAEIAALVEALRASLEAPAARVAAQ